MFRYIAFWMMFQIRRYKGKCRVIHFFTTEFISSDYMDYRSKLSFYISRDFIFSGLNWIDLDVVGEVGWVLSQVRVVQALNVVVEQIANDEC